MHLAQSPPTAQSHPCRVWFVWASKTRFLLKRDSFASHSSRARFCALALPRTARAALRVLVAAGGSWCKSFQSWSWPCSPSQPCAMSTRHYSFLVGLTHDDKDADSSNKRPGSLDQQQSGAAWDWHEFCVDSCSAFSLLALPTWLFLECLTEPRYLFLSLYLESPNRLKVKKSV